MMEHEKDFVNQGNILERLRDIVDENGEAYIVGKDGTKTKIVYV